ncbi:MAG: hypothetical protein HQK86_00615 [Nitrospinae bacterium]|nr:hypothetical protein [Nitrospinota bacterium]
MKTVKLKKVTELIASLTKSNKTISPELGEFTGFAVKEAMEGRHFCLRLMEYMKTYPVSIREFVNSPEYLNYESIVYPEVLKVLEKINNPVVEGLSNGSRVGSVYTEAVFTGAIGAAKSTTALITIAYQVYVLSCFRQPQRLFDLDPSSEILIVFQNINATLAKSVDYKRFKAMVDGSPYFREKFPYDKSLTSEMVFPNRIIVKPVSGEETATIGQNIFTALLDELNHMEAVDKSKRSMTGGNYDQATALYDSIARRRKSRFMKYGILPGILCLVSSRRYPGQFTDLKEAEARDEIRRTGKTSIYIYDKRTWDILPARNFSGKWFSVFVGNDFKKPRIIGDDEQLSTQDQPFVEKVPIEYRSEFELDITGAIRDILGKSTVALHPFILDVEAISECFGKHESILSRDDVDFHETNVEIYRQKFFHPDEAHFVHVDLALSSDSAGIVCGLVEGFTEVKRGDFIEKLPQIRIDFALEVKPPRGGEINFSKIREFLYKLRDMEMNIRWITFDSFQSADSIQMLRQKGFMTGQQSMDKTPLPYELLKQAIYDRRLKMPNNQKLFKELRELEFDPKHGKVDHNQRGSKDLSDSLAGVVYGLTWRRESWARFEVPIRDIPNSIRVMFINAREEQANESRRKY